MHKTYLCVGGPLAGRRYPASEGNGFYVMVREDTYILKFDQRVELGPIIPVKEIHYRAECFRTQEGDVMFWTPSRQTTLETMELLLATYEQAHQKP